MLTFVPAWPQPTIMQFSREWGSSWRPTRITTLLQADWTLAVSSRRSETPQTGRLWSSTLAPITPQEWIRHGPSGARSQTLWCRRVTSLSLTVRTRVSPAAIWMRTPGQSGSSLAEVSPCLCVRWVIRRLASVFPTSLSRVPENILHLGYHRQSFSKNAGLYGERVGALHVVCPTSDCAFKVWRKLSSITRSQMSTPPAHGARVVSRVGARAVM